MSDTFKYLDNKEGKAQDFLKGKINTVANASEGVVPGGSAYAKYGNLDANGKPIEASPDSTEDTSSTYETGWRSDKADGETAWGSDWNDGAYAQQLQGGGAQDSSYLSQFDSLSKGDSDVDDDGEWRTLKSLDNSGENTRADMKKLAAEWQSKGFDVRVQDLDNSQGAGWADIAVRKGTGKADAAAPDKERTPIEHSPEIKQAKERVQTYEDNVLSGKTSKEIFGGQEDNKKYNLDLNQGAEGIGQPQASDEPTEVATDSFLDSKREDIKKQYQFQPK